MLLPRCRLYSERPGPAALGTTGCAGPPRPGTHRPGRTGVWPQSSSSFCKEWLGRQSSRQFVGGAGMDRSGRRFARRTWLFGASKQLARTTSALPLLQQLGLTARCNAAAPSQIFSEDAEHQVVGGVREEVASRKVYDEKNVTSCSPQPRESSSIDLRITGTTERCDRGTTVGLVGGICSHTARSGADAVGKVDEFRSCRTFGRRAVQLFELVSGRSLPVGRVPAAGWSGSWARRPRRLGVPGRPGRALAAPAPVQSSRVRPCCAEEHTAARGK